MKSALKFLLPATAVFYLIGCGATNPAPKPATMAKPNKAKLIPYRSNVTLKVGQSAIVHGARGECGKQPRSWAEGSKRLPKPMTGFFSNGGMGLRNSSKCKGPTPAVAIRFTATKVGTEIITLFGDKINITVK